MTSARRPAAAACAGGSTLQEGGKTAKKVGSDHQSHQRTVPSWSRKSTEDGSGSTGLLQPPSVANAASLDNVCQSRSGRLCRVDDVGPAGQSERGLKKGSDGKIIRRSGHPQGPA